MLMDWFNQLVHLGDVCFKFKIYIPGYTWVGNEYTHVCYKIEKSLFLCIKVLKNEITSHNFQHSHEIIPKLKDGKVGSHEILYTF